jgi:hypothetical protein
MLIKSIKFSLASLFISTLLFVAGQSVSVLTDKPAIVQAVDPVWRSWLGICLSIIFLLFGLIADWHVHRVRKKEAGERQEIYRATLWASHHVLNNFLNKLYLIQHYAVQNGVFTDELADSMGQMIQEAAAQLLELSRVEPISAERIKQSVAPYP